MKDLTRLALALNEVAAALLALADGPAEVGPSLPAPAAPAQAFAATPAPAAVNPGNCPAHGTPWKTTKKDGTGAKRAYCPQRNPDGEFCDAKGPWLTQPPFAQ